MGCLVGLLNMVSNIQKCPKTKTKCKNTQPPTTILLFLLVVWLLLCFCFLGRRPSGMCGLTSGLILNLLPTKSSSFCLPDDDMLIQRTLLNYLGPNFRHQANSWAWQKGDESKKRLFQIKGTLYWYYILQSRHSRTRKHENVLAWHAAYLNLKFQHQGSNM